MPSHRKLPVYSCLTGREEEKRMKIHNAGEVAKVSSRMSANPSFVWMERRCQRTWHAWASTKLLPALVMIVGAPA